MSTVLVVDDSKAIRQLVSYTLNQEKHKVIQAEDGWQALDIAHENKVDLVITDKNMPMMDGIELTKHLRSRIETKYVPILMLTTQSGTDEKAKGKIAGVTGWLVKPFDPDSLVSVMKRLLN